jgi:hypothetical protein
MSDDKPAYGLLAEFETPDALIEAARRARDEGYRKLDAFTPFPVEELTKILRLRDQRVLWLAFFGGCFGAGLALAMQSFTNWSYPINVGGRPLYALSAFAVVTFELTVLFGALAPAFGMLALNRLPRLHDPVFSARRFHLASRDRFFLCIMADDSQFDEESTTRFLEGLGARSVEAVPS